MAKVPVIDKELRRIADAIANSHSGTTSKAQLDAMFEALLDGENTTMIFRKWWPLARAQDDDETRYATLCRWFKMLSVTFSDRIYTLRGPLYSANTTGNTALTPLADLAGKTAAGVHTELDPDSFEWTDEDPMTWYVRGNALSLTDGTMNVLAVEGVDDTFDITGATGPVYCFALSLWKAHYTDGSYEYKSFATAEHGGMRPMAGDVAPDDSHRIMTWHATFGGSLITENGTTRLTSGVGNKPAIKVSASSGLTYARNTSAYEGLFSDTDLEYIIDQWQLRHFNLENSGILEGCLNYNYQYVVAMGESDATSVLLTTIQAENLVEGSYVAVGSHPEGTNNDRGTAANFDLVAFAKITRIETVTIEAVQYARLHLDIAEAVTIPATALVSTMPWAPGSTERLPGHKDGSLYNCTNGKTPARIAGMELIDGTYAIGLDPLWVEDYDADRNPKCIYSMYECKDSVYQAASAGEHHSLAGTFQSNGTSWQYIKHLAINTSGLIYPDALGGSSTTFMKSAFLFHASSGARAPWRFCDLGNSAHGGLAGASGHFTPSAAYWYGRPRLSGSGKKRGEWAA